ncbi:unnamed protein product [Heterobilharzia americana]|nr:unnamed protein product [Heterobilharzia americana]
MDTKDVYGGESWNSYSQIRTQGYWLSSLFHYTSNILFQLFYFLKCLPFKVTCFQNIDKFGIDYKLQLWSENCGSSPLLVVAK